MQKRIIELEETRNVRHQIFVVYNDEEDLDRAIENFEGDNLDDIVENIGNYVTITDVNEEYYQESEGFELYDDYEEDY